MSRSRQRIDRIKQEIPIVEVLLHYGYRVHDGGGDTEIQFPCDLHGDGQDNKPSARVYPATASFYCFACSKSYDAVNLVQIKENLKFPEACRWLEKKYNLPPLPWSEDDYQAPLKPEEEIRSSFQRSRTYEEDRDRIESMLEVQTQDKALPMKDVVAFWELFDKICWYVEEGALSDAKARTVFQEIRKKVQEREHGAILRVPADQHPVG